MVSERVVNLVYNEDTPQRLDKYLVSCLPEFSRARLQGLIKDGFVLIDGDTAQKSGQTLDKQTHIEVHIPPPLPTTLIPENIPLDIIYEDDNLLVVNKPAGMVVHPAAGHASGTLVHAALAHSPDMEGIGGEIRPGIVHRLDKDTSGLILLAKNDRTHLHLAAQFRDRKVHKTYLALVDGSPPTPSGRVEAAIGRNPKDRKQMAVVASGQGRPAVSEYHTLETFRQHAFLEVHPITGRTHQIRLHLRFIGCPVSGDRMYGRQKASIPLERHFLHAAHLRLRLAREAEERTFSAPLPAELEEALLRLRAEK